jgi:hypothetical protein
MKVFELEANFVRMAASASAKWPTERFTRFMFAKTTVKLGWKFFN